MCNVLISTGCKRNCKFCTLQKEYECVNCDSLIKQVKFGIFDDKITLIANNLNDYENNGQTFIDLLENILQNNNNKSVKLFSLTPDIDTDRFFSLFEKYPQLQRELHIKAIHLIPHVLQDLNLSFTVEQIEEFINKAKKLDISVYIEILVCTPTETDSDFDLLLQKLALLNCDKIVLNVYVHDFQKADAGTNFDEQYFKPSEILPSEDLSDEIKINRYNKIMQDFGDKIESYDRFIEQWIKE